MSHSSKQANERQINSEPAETSISTHDGPNMLPDQRTPADDQSSHSFNDRHQVSAERETHGGTGPLSSSTSTSDASAVDSDELPNVPATRWRWLSGAFVSLPIAVITAFAVWWLQGPVYTATAILRLAATKDTLLLETADKKGSANSDSFDLFKRTQGEWMRSRFVFMRALRETRDLEHITVLRKHPDPGSWLETNLSVTFPGESEVMHVSLSGESPEGLDRLLNAVVKAYFDEIVNEEAEKKRERLNGLEVAYKQADSELRSKRNDLRQLVERVGTGDSSALTLVQQNSLNQFAAFQQQYSKVRFELLQAEGELNAATSALDAKSQLSDRQLRIALRTDPMAVQIDAEKQLVVDQLQELLTRAQDGIADPKQEEIEKLLRNLHEKYQLRHRSLRQELIDEKQEAAAAEIDSLKHKIQLLMAQEAQLKQKSHELEAEANQIGKSSIDVEMIRSEIAAMQNVMSLLLNELQRTQVELQSDARTGWARVTLKSEAPPPQRVNSRIRLPATIGAGVASLLLSLLLVVWLTAPRVHPAS